MAFKGRDPVRTKIVVDKIIEKVNSFIYLRNISYEKELDIDNKLHNYFKITGNLINVFRPRKDIKKTKIKLCNTLANFHGRAGNRSRDLMISSKKL
jgi:hypothetical protein